MGEGGHYFVTFPLLLNCLLSHLIVSITSNLPCFSVVSPSPSPSYSSSSSFIQLLEGNDLSPNKRRKRSAVHSKTVRVHGSSLDLFSPFSLTWVDRSFHIIYQFVCSLRGGRTHKSVGVKWPYTDNPSERGRELFRDFVAPIYSSQSVILDCYSLFGSSMNSSHAVVTQTWSIVFFPSLPSLNSSLSLPFLRSLPLTSQ